MRLNAVALGALLLTLEPGSAPGSYLLDGEFWAEATPAVAWQVLTDYDGIGGFVSSIRSSRVLRRGTGTAVIEQEGTGRFLLFSRSVKLTLEVREERPKRLDFRDIEGRQFKQYEGSWTIASSSGGCRVGYRLAAQPDPSLGPRFAAKAVLKKNARRLLEEVRAEIEHRARDSE